MSEHSPTPWKTETRSPSLLVGGDGYTVNLSDSTYTAFENAVFIVHAVNAHEELVDALRRLVEWHTAEPCPAGTLDDRLRDARATLAKAKAR